MSPAEDDSTRKSPRFNVPRSREDVIRDVRRINQLSERVLDELCAVGRAEAPLRRRRDPRPPAATGPAPVAQNLCLVRTGKGGAVVSFDGGKPIALPPTVAELIAILASGGGQSEDEFLAWKSFDEMCERLEKKLGRKFDHHNVSQVLTRLRTELRKAELDRLIESSPPKGVRLRVKRCPAILGAP